MLPSPRSPALLFPCPLCIYELARQPAKKTIRKLDPRHAIASFSMDTADDCNCLRENPCWNG
jgi:hypothetical protein